MAEMRQNFLNYLQEVLANVADNALASERELAIAQERTVQKLIVEGLEKVANVAGIIAWDVALNPSFMAMLWDKPEQLIITNADADCFVIFVHGMMSGYVILGSQGSIKLELYDRYKHRVSSCFVHPDCTTVGWIGI